MLLERRVTASTFTPGASSTSYLVTVGPREKPTTAASTPNSLNTLVIDATTWSFAADLALGGVPGAKIDSGGITYGRFTFGAAGADAGMETAGLGAAAGWATGGIVIGTVSVLSTTPVLCNPAASTEGTLS